MANIYVPEMLTNFVFIKTKGSQCKKSVQKKEERELTKTSGCWPWTFAGNGTTGQSVDPGARPSEFESGSPTNHYVTLAI